MRKTVDMKLVRALLIVLSILLLSQILPWTYDLLFGKGERPPFTLYSEVEQEFVQTQMTNDGLVRQSISGKKYSEAEFDSILPCLYARQLAADNRFPEKIMNQAVTPQLVRYYNYTFRFSPKSINAHPPKAYQLLESASGRVNLESASDIFVFRDGKILFIDSEDNQINEEKSKRFQRPFEREKVQFPIVVTAGDGNTRKEYDEGYLLLDSNNQLFHFKQVKGKPYLVRINTSNMTSKIIGIDLIGASNRKMLGYAYTEDGKVYTIHTPEYKLQLVELPTMDPRSTNWMAIGNMFYTTYRIVHPYEVEYIAVETATGKHVDSYNISYSKGSTEYIEEILFPFQTTFTSSDSKLVYPRFKFGMRLSPLVSLFFAILYLAFRRHHFKRQRLVLHFILILLTGIYGFIALWLLCKRDRKKAILEDTKSLEIQAIDN